MAYVKNTWVDQDVERPKTYEVTNNQDGSITLTDSFGLVTELGTPVNAVNMNHIEDGLVDIDVTKYNATTTYNAGEWVTGVVDNEKGIYASKVNNNTGNALTNDTYWEKVELGGGGAGHNLFDIVPKDHILSYEETKGFAQLGSYVYKEAVAGSRYGYPDFYSKVLAEYQDLNNTTETVSGITITVNANGHKFYDIADKADIDSLFTARGEAWFYGVDTTNERIFLPRSTRVKFGDTSAVGEYQQAGLPNVEGTVYGTDFLESPVATGAFYNAGTVGSEAPAGGSGTSVKLGFDASRANSIYGNSNTVEYSSTKLIPYMVVGNTMAESAIGEYVDVTTTENDTLPLFYGAYFDYTPNNVSWVLAGGQVASGTIYEFAYNELVNELSTPKYGLQVIEEDDMVVGVDYSTYWKVNQDQQYFIAPTKLSYVALTGGVKGNGLALGMSNGSINFGATTVFTSYTRLYPTTNAYDVNVGTSASTGTETGGEQAIGLTADATKSGIIAEQSTTAKLYFKVANAVQNLELLDAGEVLEAVNDLIPDNSSLIASYAMPSNKYINITVGASGSTYTAPANGWFYIKKEISANQYLAGVVLDTNLNFVLEVVAASTGTNSDTILIPVQKNYVVRISYNASGSTSYFRFIYAQGSESEAN